MKIAAVIFDLDGTVLSNEDEYGAAFRKVLARLGKKVDKKYPHISGIGVRENWPHLLAKYKIKTKRSLEELTKATQDAYLEQLGRVTVKRGLEEFIRDLKDSGIMTALATSNEWWIVDEMLEELNLERLFNITTTGEEVDFKKPDPALFLVTSRKLGVEPEECLVIEDSEAGIQAAHEVGMKVVGIFRDRKHAQKLREADLLISGYSQLTPEKIHQL
jgi:HAD superfamily hydrolase (TIGR01509 family)